MPMCLCYKCLDKNYNEVGDISAASLLSYYAVEDINITPDKALCPSCKTPLVLPPDHCGKCIHSAELSDGYLICCLKSVKDQLSHVPYNGQSLGCPTYDPMQTSAEIEEMLDSYTDASKSESHDKTDAELEAEFDESFRQVNS